VKKDKSFDFTTSQIKNIYHQGFEEEESQLQIEKRLMRQSVENTKKLKKILE
jgi:hypothetical protein